MSNQKYRELTEEFGDVGLMTGDTSILPHAACVVMTTEILRSMAYRGSELLSDVGWVIFDEVHYMHDRERGVVWEECIIFTPPGARCVFLSATLPNALEFASWVAGLHAAPCHVVYTDTRPTPLQHYAFPLGGEGLYLVVDEAGRFREDNFAKMRESFKKDDAGGAGGRGRGGRGGRGGRDGGGRGGRGGRGDDKDKSTAPDVYKARAWRASTCIACTLLTTCTTADCEAVQGARAHACHRFLVQPPRVRGAMTAHAMALDWSRALRHGFNTELCASDGKA